METKIKLLLDIVKLLYATFLRKHPYISSFFSFILIGLIVFCIIGENSLDSVVNLQFSYLREGEYTTRLSSKHFCYVCSLEELAFIEPRDEIFIKADGYINYGGDLRKDFSPKGIEFGGMHLGLWVLLHHKSSSIEATQAIPYKEEGLYLKIEGSGLYKLFFFLPEKNLSQKSFYQKIIYWVGLEKDPYEDNVGSYALEIKIKKN